MSNPDKNRNICSKENGTCIRGCKEPCGQLVTLWDKCEVEKVSSLPSVKGVFALGTLLAVQLRAPKSGYESNVSADIVDHLRKRGVYARPLGDVVYLMVTPFTTRTTCNELLVLLNESILTAIDK